MTAHLLREHFRDRWRSYASLFVMVILTAAVYFPPDILTGADALLGMDYFKIHKLRLAFAQDALFGPSHTLPGWFPRELLGAPFSANLQSFPWIPTRFVLLLLDPDVAYFPGVMIAALLAAVFTYLYCRRAGLSEVASAASGWTFACAGFFASRVMAGHLPLLEAYPALPFLLWLADRALDAERAKHHWLDVGRLAIGSTCVLLAGHPQLPAYAVGATMLYVIWRGRRWLRARLACALALGSAISLAAWWPMLLLIRRSTRVLNLDPPQNDIAFPYRRVLALIDPGIDGWPPTVSRAAQHPFSGYPNGAYFFDTASYVGLAPWIAVAVLLLICCARKRLPAGRFMFLACVGLGAFIAALPLLEFLRHFLPGMIFRSPARLLYLSTFSLSVALGAAVDAVLAFKLLAGGTLRYVAVAVGLVLHAVDLGNFARLFVVTTPLTEEPQLQAAAIKDSRVAIDTFLWPRLFSSRRRFDDVGAFDSLLLAKPYLAVLAMTGAPSTLNDQTVNGAALTQSALEASAVAFVVTPHTRTDLALLSQDRGIKLYGVENPVPRASFYGAQSVVFLPQDEIIASLRSHTYSSRQLLMPAESRNLVVATPEIPPANVVYHRPSSDEILLEVSAGGSGFVHVVEAYDPGWVAQVDGQSASLFAANGFTLAAPVTAGKHVVRFSYHTPGRPLGVALSVLAATLLALLMWFSRPGKHLLR